MIDLFLNGLYGLLNPTFLVICLLGAMYGTLIGVIPGIGPAAGAAVISPILFNVLPLEQSVIILSSIMYGAQYGGSISSILLNIPGESTSAITTLDGYPLTKQGKATSAITVAAISSFIGGCIAIIFITSSFNAIVSVSLKLSSVHYLCILLVVLTILILTFTGNKIKNCISLLFGILLGFIGFIGIEDRLMFGFIELDSGLDFTIVAICLFGVGNTILNALKSEYRSFVYVQTKTTIKDITSSILPAIRGGLIGLFSIFPGLGANISTIMSYTAEKFISKTPEKFGTGFLPGVAGPESANNSASQVGFLPILLLGVPTGAITAMLAALLMANNMHVGPLFPERHSTIFWTIISSMLVVNVFLLFLNWPLMRIWILVLKIQPKYLYVGTLFVCCFIISLTSSSLVELLIAAGLVTISLFLWNRKYSPVHVIFGFIFGKIIEDNFLRWVTITRFNYDGLINDAIMYIIVLFCVFLLMFRFSKEQSL